MFARLRFVRVRVTLLATAIVGLTLSGAGFGLVALQERTLTNSLEDSLRLRAEDLAALLTAAGPPRTIAVVDPEVSVIQVVDGTGRVVSSSANAVGLVPIGATGPQPGNPSFRDIDLPAIDDEPFRVLSRTVDGPSGPLTIHVAGSLDAVTDSTEVLAALLRFGIPGVLVAIGGTTWVMVGRTLAPVEAIRAEVERIGGRDLGRRVPAPRTKDEVGRLAETMNAMLARLESSALLRDQFVADAAHELRSPLAGLRTEVEVAHDAATDRAGAEIFERLLGDIARLEGLTSNLLVLAKADAGAVAAGSLPMDLDDIVLDEAARIRSGTGVTVDTTAVSGGAVTGDPGQLTSAVRNLLDNAVRHAKHRVEVTLAEVNGEVALSVADDGSGIAVEDRLRVFDRFVRLDSSRARSRGGAGLGLAIVRAVIEGHGGSVSVDDSPLGGARFVVRLPSQTR